MDASRYLQHITITATTPLLCTTVNIVKIRPKSTTSLQQPHQHHQNNKSKGKITKISTWITKIWTQITKKFEQKLPELSRSQILIVFKSANGVNGARVSENDINGIL